MVKSSGKVGVRTCPLNRPSEASGIDISGVEGPQVQEPGGQSTVVVGTDSLDGEGTGS
ncbi:unnamed protein product, partial [Cyprideis torosa]